MTRARLGLIILLLAGLSSGFRISAEEKKHILILHSYHQGFPWTDSIGSGISEVFEHEEMDVQLYFEYMDSKRFFDGLEGSLFNRLKVHYKEKYKTVPLDGLIVSDDNAFRFALLHHRELFPGVPLVFCGVNHYSGPESHEGLPVTGFEESIDYREIIELARGIKPDIRNIAIITDITATGRANRKILRDIVYDYRDLADFSFLDETGEGIHFADLLNRLEELPDDTVVYISDFFRDRERYIDPEEMIREISERSPVPVMSHNGADLGYGIIGGRLNYGKFHGEAAAVRLIEILQGKEARDIPVTGESLNRYMFDYSQLKRFDIPVKTLPPGSVIINRPDNIWQKYRSFFITGFAAFILLITSNILLRISLSKRTLKLKESERRFRLLSENIPGVVYLCADDANYSLLYINNACKDLFGISRNRIEIGKTGISEFIHEEDLPAVHEEVKKALEDHRPYIIQYRVRKASGEIIRAEEIGTGVFDKGRLLYLEGFIHDITRRFLNEKEKEELISSLEEALAKVKDLSGMLPNIIQYRVRKASGEIIRAEEIGTGVFDKGRLLYLEGFIHDITRRFLNEKEKEELISSLEEALAKVKDLSGMLPICARCKKIRNDDGFWEQVETYISKHSNAEFSHSLCQDCMEELYGNEEWYKESLKE